MSIYFEIREYLYLFPEEEKLLLEIWKIEKKVLTLFQEQLPLEFRNYQINQLLDVEINSN